MRHDRRRIFPMESPQSRASLRVIKPSPKLNRRRQPKIRSGKIVRAVKNNYSNFAATAVLAVTLVLLGLSLSHLAAGMALVTGAGPSDGWLMAIGIDRRHIGRVGGDERICLRGICERPFDLYLDEGCRDALDRCMTSRARINPGRNAISLHFRGISLQPHRMLYVLSHLKVPLLSSR